MNATRRDSGFSLIEVMVAILILGVAVTGLVHGISTALATSKESELQTVAALFAQGKIEELRADGTWEDGETEGDCGSAFATYRWRQTIRGTEIPGLHDVSMAVEQAQNGRSIYTLKTLLFNADDADLKNRSKKSSSSKRGRRST